MKPMKEDSVRRSDHFLDPYLAVEELHGLSSREMNKLLRDSDNFSLRVNTGKGSSMQVNMEKLAGCLPLHLLAVLVSSSGGEGPIRLRYLLHSVRLLYSLGDLASRHAKLEQMLLEDPKATEQILDLVIYILLVLARFEPEGRVGSFLTLHQHAALVACSLHLLTVYVSPQWQDIANVLLAHSEVDIFMDAAFDAVRKDIIYFQIKLRTLNAKIMTKKTTLLAAERIAHIASQHCEASLQVLQSLCLHTLFRERLLKNKELCRNGGILLLALSVLKFQMPSSFTDSSYVVASVSRLKSKVLSILMQLCETESFSYLDEVASSPRSMRLAVLVASEVLDLLKGILHKESTQVEGSSDNIPKGHLLLNSMRLADIFSDDSNFRSFIMNKITQDLADISALHPSDFLASWCADDTQVFEEDATLVYDPFRAAGTAMLSLKGGGSVSSGPAAGLPNKATSIRNLVGNCMPPTSHSQQKTAFLVKIFANLHCYVPDICKEQEKNQFFKKFIQCLSLGPLNPTSKLYFWSEAQTAVRICENLCSLWDHAMPLIPSLLNEEDVILLSEFLLQLHKSICPGQPQNGAIQEEPMVEYLREKHDNKFKVTFEKHQPYECYTKSHNSPEIDEKDQITTGISIDRDIENQPSAHEVSEKDVRQISEEAVSTGGCGPSTERKQEGIMVDENSSLQNVKREPEENNEIDDIDAISQMVNVQFQVAQFKETKVDIQEVDQYKEMEIEQASTKNEILDPDENQEAINSSTRSEVESAPEIDHNDKNLEIRNEDNSMAMDKVYFYNQDASRETGENQNRVDGEKEDEGAGSMAQATERVDTNISEDKQPKKRKRNVMNEQQIALIEAALRDEPEMQRSAHLLQLWTERLREYGSPDLTTSQLKNWLNNRKAKLARLARESRTSDGENMSDRIYLPRSSPAISGEHGVVMGSFYDSPESNTGEDFYGTSAGPRRGNQSGRFPTPVNSRSSAEDLHGMPPVEYEFAEHVRVSVTPPPLYPSVRFVPCEAGQLVSLRDESGVEVAHGIVLQVEGRWHGRQLDEQGLCVVEIIALKVDRRERLPHPSDVSGTTFEEAETLNGRMIVVWNTHKILLLPPPNIE
ncbi:nodulin homeobox isoform X1 [Cryptomeria japonica]|uniref:nodulin homeobox isoform X1 n=2 Tax=Cryptomeria japonica TaxID=3369 RepID=UPI0027D9DCE8|nr:nodulin homeobox isoform X1 [Cryptomeria japonica]